jgi:RND family efflux transporter MFP subunit
MVSQRVFAAAVFALLLLGASCSRPGNAETKTTGDSSSLPVVAVQRASINTLDRNLTLTAEFEPYQEIDVMAKVAGYVKQINVDIGDRVRSGELLATLEVPEMTNELAKAEAGVERSNAEMKEAQDDVQRAKAAHTIAHLSYQRLNDVSKARPGLVAQEEIDNARSKDLVTEAQISAAQSSLAAAEQELKVNQAEQARLKTMFNYTIVSAPFTGVITKRYADTGSMIQAGTSSQSQAMPIVRLSQNNLLRLILPVPESAVSGIHIGQPVEVRVPTLHRSFSGKVARYADKVKVSTRTMDTEVDVKNPSLVLIPGMYAEVNLQLAARDDVLSIPVAAVDNTGVTTRVFKVTPEGVIEVVPVVIGIQTSTSAEVRTGLEEGDMIVVGNRAGLRPGEKVQPKVVSLYDSKTT